MSRELVEPIGLWEGYPYQRELTKEEIRELKETANAQLTWEEIFLAAGLKPKTRSTGTVYALCTFHSEKTPSLVGYPKSNTFICYGCGEGGDKYAFLCSKFNSGHILSKPELEAVIRMIGPVPQIGQTQMKI